MIEDEELKKIFDIIEKREIDDVKFERFKDKFNLECDRCGKKSAKITELFGLICLYCDSHVIEKKEI